VAQFVDVSVPARPQFLSLVRLALGSVGAQLDLTLEELDDLQLAGEELCLSLLGEALSEQILDALVDDHGRAAEDGAVIAWLRKRRGERLPAP